MTKESRRRRLRELESQIEHWSTLYRVTVVLDEEQTWTIIHTSVGEQVSR